MTTTDQIFEKLNQIESKLDEQALLQKSVLNFSEATRYLAISPSHLYKLTSTRQIPHFCPQGKKLYFNRHELDRWLLSHRHDTLEEIQQQAADYLVKKGRIKL